VRAPKVGELCERRPAAVDEGAAEEEEHAQRERADDVVRELTVLFEGEDLDGP
jgi:hypothetical protein